MCRSSRMTSRRYNRHRCKNSVCRRGLPITTDACSLIHHHPLTFQLLTDFANRGQLDSPFHDTRAYQVVRTDDTSRLPLTALLPTECIKGTATQMAAKSRVEILTYQVRNENLMPLHRVEFHTSLGAIPGHLKPTHNMCRNKPCTILITDDITNYIPLPVFMQSNPPLSLQDLLKGLLQAEMTFDRITAHPLVWCDDSSGGTRCVSVSHPGSASASDDGSKYYRSETFRASSSSEVLKADQGAHQLTDGSGSRAREIRRSQTNRDGAGQSGTRVDSGQETENSQNTCNARCSTNLHASVSSTDTTPHCLLPLRVVVFRARSMIRFARLPPCLSFVRVWAHSPASRQSFIVKLVADPLMERSKWQERKEHTVQ
jgi:hypothetical protein